MRRTNDVKDKWFVGQMTVGQIISVQMTQYPFKGQKRLRIVKN